MENIFLKWRFSYHERRGKKYRIHSSLEWEIFMIELNIYWRNVSRRATGKIKLFKAIYKNLYFCIPNRWNGVLFFSFLHILAILYIFLFLIWEYFMWFLYTISKNILQIHIWYFINFNLHCYISFQTKI